MDANLRVVGKIHRALPSRRAERASQRPDDYGRWTLDLERHCVGLRFRYRALMKTWLALLLFLTTLAGATGAETSADEKRVVIIPIREQIASPLVYLVRRGVK